MKKEEIEKAALNLPLDQRSELIQNLLLSIEQDSEDEILEEWIREAKTRAEQLNNGSILPVSTEEVREKAKALLR